MDLISLGELSKPATVLIEKVSDAIGGIAKPWQMKRIAKAEAEVKMIHLRASIEENELIEERAFGRLLGEEAQKQKNIEDITCKAIPHLLQDSKPENIGKDWLVRFFDRSRLTSDEQMQSLWSKILAGEANVPGTFSRRTIDIVDSLDKKDAQLFTSFCSFCWMLGNDIQPFIYDNQHSIHNKVGVNFISLNHLVNIGLINIEATVGYEQHGVSKHLTLSYYGQRVTIEFPNDKNIFQFGNALFTQAGKELAPICGAAPSSDYFDYIINEWKKKGYILSGDIPNKL